MSQDPEELDLFDQVFHALVDMGKAADGFSGQVRGGRGQVPVFRIVGQGIGHGRRAEMGGRGRVLGDVLDPFPFIVNDMIQFLEKNGFFRHSDASKNVKR